MLGVNIPDKGRCLPDYESVYGSRFHAAQRDGQTVVSRLREPHADHRLSLPSEPAGDLREPYVSQPDGSVAVRRPLQMAGHAGERRRGAVHYRRCVSDYDKFLAYARTLPMRSAIRSTIGRIWSCAVFRHRRDASTSGTRRDLGDRRTPSCRAAALPRGTSSRSRRWKSICTTDDPADSLEHHCSCGQDAELRLTGAAFLPAGQGAGNRTGRHFSAYVRPARRGGAACRSRRTTICCRRWRSRVRLFPRSRLPRVRPCAG